MKRPERRGNIENIKKSNRLKSFHYHKDTIDRIKYLVKIVQDEDASRKLLQTRTFFIDVIFVYYMCLIYKMFNMSSVVGVKACKLTQ